MNPNTKKVANNIEMIFFIIFPLLVKFNETHTNRKIKMTQVTIVYYDCKQHQITLIKKTIQL